MTDWKNEDLRIHNPNDHSRLQKVVRAPKILQKPCKEERKIEAFRPFVMIFPMA